VAPIRKIYLGILSTPQEINLEIFLIIKRI
jgi:hypothetical protein